MAEKCPVCGFSALRGYYRCSNPECMKFTDEVVNGKCAICGAPALDGFYKCLRCEERKRLVIIKDGIVLTDQTL